MTKIEKQLLEISNSKYDYDFIKYLVNLLIQQDKNNRALIESEVHNIIDKKDKEHMEELRKATEDSKNWNLKNTDCICGQFYSNNDYAWFR
jgi:flagellar biosynthesis/type III secretory pathway chaperone